jgi:hypothetical protein
MKIGAKSTKTTLVVQPNALGAELISVPVGLTPYVDANMYSFWLHFYWHRTQGLDFEMVS